MGLRVGIDIGGTFTDVVFLDDQGQVTTRKVLSTPDDYSRGIMDGLLAGGSLGAAAVRQFMHGTTVATNAILEGKGARVGLITTTGFRDVLEIRRLRMPALYDIRWRKPPPLVPRRLRREIPERINAHGEIERALDRVAAAHEIDILLTAGVEAIAVCLINAYANGTHERSVRDLVRERNREVPVSLSSELVPEIKEYERTSTTVVNAYVLPPVRRYLRRLKYELDVNRIATPLGIIQSSGGVMRAEVAAERPFNIIESGPAAGVVGAAELARILCDQNVLAFDMGGTTAKAALVRDGAFVRVGSLDVGGGINIAGRLLKGGGYHVSAPAIDIAEVGAGGGSIVRLDAGGGLRVGPDSAGSVPGPACYGRGGAEPTVTDANLVLGLINPEGLAGGSLPVDRMCAVRALETGLGGALRLPVEEVAWGVHRLANATMARALRAVSTERGLDPRGFALMAFGGNGPVHAATLAQALEISRILVPPVPGVFSSLGMLFPEVEHHYVRTHKRPLEAGDLTWMRAAFEQLASEGAEALDSEGFAAGNHAFDRFADLRYSAANSELTVPVALDQSAGELRLSFEDAHERQYGYRSAREVVEVVNLRLVARGLSSSGAPAALRIARADPPGGQRAIYLGPERGWVTAPIIGRSEVSDAWSSGPLLVEEYDTTTVVPPDARVRRLAWDTLELELR
jgi:N-methylhydantoinase A